MNLFLCVSKDSENNNLSLDGFHAVASFCTSWDSHAFIKFGDGMTRFLIVMPETV